MSKLSFHDGSCCRCGSGGELYRFTEFGKAVCPECYPLFFQRRVARTMRRYGMVSGGDTIAVAVSGGKDSTALLHSLWNLRHRLHLTVVALHIDMGLAEYSEQSLQAVRELVESLGVPLVIERVADHGVRIEPAGNFRMCSVCGAVRRALLDRVGLREGFAAIATGHTLDDRLQQMLKRLLTGRLDAPRPILLGDEFHPRKIKPLSFIPDRASKAYAELLRLPHLTAVCPQFDPESHRLKAVFELLEELAPMGKSQLVNTLHKAMKADVPGAEDRPCPDCGNPTGTEVCPLCRLQRLQG
ncbi:MAG: tRNA lysidine(34) synthetase [Armatimonadota bacterium]